MTLIDKNKKDKLEGPCKLMARMLPYLLAIVLWGVLALRGQYYLKKVEDLSLFMFDWSFFIDAIRIPGGFLGITGSFFTQFLHIPWLGSLIWVVMLLMMYKLTIKAVNIPESLRALAIIPVALIIIGNMSLGYGVFIMRAQDHFFAPVLGYFAALIPVFAVKRANRLWTIILIISIYTIAGYPLFGVFALIGTFCATILAALGQNKLLNRTNRLAILAAGMALICLIPLVFYNLYTSYRLADSWHIGLPSVSDDLWTRTVRTPFQLALLFLPVMVLILHKYRENRNLIGIQISIFAITAVSVWGFWFKDDNFRTELAMSEAVDQFEWQKVINIYRKAVNAHTESDKKAYAARSKKLQGIRDQNAISEITNNYSDRFFEPTRTMVLYRDLALIKMNRALNDAFTMKDGGQLQNTLTQVPMALQSGKQLYFQYGLPNLCYRWCIEDAVEHSWSVGTLKYMSMLSILTGEKEMAIKFLCKLDRTLFHKKWSKQYRSLLDDTDHIARTDPFSKIMPLMCFDDMMTNDLGKTESHLIKHFTRPRPAQATPEYDMTALFWAMRTQSIPDFWERLQYYLQTNTVKEIPRSVQEAAILYQSLENRGIGLEISDDVRDSYSKFTQYVAKHPVRYIKESSFPYSQQFGKTFFYFYYFTRDLQTY